jgi:anhydro-N-acetylmuramic acid kinase
VTRYFIGLMSGTSLDGVDGVVLRHNAGGLSVTHARHLPMPTELRRTFLTLNTPGPNELHTAALATNRLMQCHAQVVQALLEAADLPASEITAIGVHGQTVRHQPGPVGSVATLHVPWTAYSVQLCNPALLAELCCVTVIADFRSRDVAAGGQGAPLVPAFHRAVFGKKGASVAVVNVGGMANATLLGPHGETSGFDTGPGNVLMDLWCETHTGHTYDDSGAWAASGRCHHPLLNDLLAEPYFSQQGARSTGRDLFNRAWLQARLAPHTEVTPADVQATLLSLTAQSIAQALPTDLDTCVVCGGGAFNSALMAKLQVLMHPAQVVPSDEAGMPAMQVEAAAFAWLALQTWLGLPGNVPSATGATGHRVLGAIYPA